MQSVLAKAYACKFRLTRQEMRLPQQAVTVHGIEDVDQLFAVHLPASPSSIACVDANASQSTALKILWFAKN